MKIKSYTLSTFLLVITFQIASLFGQQSTSSLPELREINEKLRWLEVSIENKEKRIAESTSPQLQKELQEEILGLKQRREEFKNRFLSVAADINLHDTQALESDKRRNIIEELQIFALPILDSLQRMSARPRLIESLRRKIDVFDGKMGILEEGKKRIDLYLLESTPDLKQRLEDAKEVITLQLGDLQMQRDDLDRLLQLELRKDKSFLESASDLMKGFFGRRGKNLLWAIAIYFVVSTLLWRVRRALWPKKLIEKKGWTFLIRPIRLLYPFMVFILSFLSSLLCLYFLNDWLLVTLMSLILLSLFWSFKQVAPRFIQEARLMLNLGTVKEGEMLFYQGIYWKVENLFFTAQLRNPYLQDNGIKLAAKDLLGLFSKVIPPHHIWFPSQVGEYIKLSDGVYGMVVSQSSEVIIVESSNGPWHYYSIGKYLELVPQNFSSSFWVDTVWTLHHDEKSNLFHIADDLKKKLATFLTDQRKIDFQELKVVFSHSDGRGLHMSVMLHAPGSMAKYYPTLPSTLQEECLRVSLDKGWKLPTSPLSFLQTT